MSNSISDINSKTNNFSFQITDLDEESTRKIKQKFKGIVGDYVSVGPKKYCLLKGFKQACPVAYNFPVRPNDIWLFGFPRSGTTLMQEILWLIGNDLNYEKASESVVDLRFPYFDPLLMTFVETHDYPMNVLTSNTNIDNKGITSITEKVDTLSLEHLMEMKERRFIKTHLPISLFNPDVLKNGCKVVYIMRNPKDVLVSGYHLAITFKYVSFNGSLEEYWKLFSQNLCLLSPYFEHIKEGWENRNNPNVLFIYYEEFVNDMKKALKKVSNFMEKPLSNEQLDKLEDHLKIDNFQKNKSVNNDHLRKMGVMKDEDNVFIRKGKVNGWKDYFTEKMNAEVDQWIKENMKDCDLQFFE